jgi:hypothetical protein
MQLSSTLCAASDRAVDRASSSFDIDVIIWECRAVTVPRAVVFHSHTKSALTQKILTSTVLCWMATTLNIAKFFSDYFPATTWRARARSWTFKIVTYFRMQLLKR